MEEGLTTISKHPLCARDMYEILCWGEMMLQSDGSFRTVFNGAVCNEINLLKRNVEIEDD